MIERAEGKKDLRSRSRLGRVGVGSGVFLGAKGHERESQRETPKSQYYVGLLRRKFDWNGGLS